MNIDKWIEEVLKCNILPESAIKKLCRKAKTILFEQSNVQPVQSPVTICGDVHGQFHDVLVLFDKGGWLPNTRYIFLGDYVDRGYHSVQTITLLLCLKVKYPELVVLLRGNHESRTITNMCGFYDQVMGKYGNQSVWSYFNDVFDYLPLAAIVEGEIFCVHGGLSPHMNSIDHIRSIQRNIEIPNIGPFADLMWSDPQETVDSWVASPRGAGRLFGRKVVEQFMKNNKLTLIARAHQLANTGYMQYFDKKLFTVWSAPNYCYRMGNKASIMKIDSSLSYQFITFSQSPNSVKSQAYKTLIPYFL